MSGMQFNPFLCLTHLTQVLLSLVWWVRVLESPVKLSSVVVGGWGVGGGALRETGVLYP